MGDIRFKFQKCTLNMDFDMYHLKLNLSLITSYLSWYNLSPWQSLIKFHNIPGNRLKLYIVSGHMISLSGDMHTVYDSSQKVWVCILCGFLQCGHIPVTSNWVIEGLAVCKTVYVCVHLNDLFEREGGCLPTPGSCLSSICPYKLTKRGVKLQSTSQALSHTKMTSLT